MEQGNMSGGLVTYITYREWLEAEFAYAEFVVNASRSGLTGQDLHRPPLQIVTSERTF